MRTNHVLIDFENLQIADALRDSSHRKGIVLDPFAGSGTILVAAERTGRHARAI